MSIAADKLKKSQLEVAARAHRSNSVSLRQQAQELEESSTLVSSLLPQ